MLQLGATRRTRNHASSLSRIVNMCQTCLGSHVLEGEHVDSSKLDIVWGVLKCLEHLRPLPSSLVDSMVATYHRLLAMVASDVAPPTSREVVTVLCQCVRSVVCVMESVDVVKVIQMKGIMTLLK